MVFSKMTKSSKIIILLLYHYMLCIFFKELEAFHGQTWRRWLSSIRGVKTRYNRSWEGCTELDTFFPSYPTRWPPRASPEHQSSARRGWKGWNQASGNATKTSTYVCNRKNGKKSLRFLFIYISALFLSPNCSLKGQGQVECKFYNELGRILVKDFPSVPQLDEVPGEPEDNNFPAYSHHEIGKHEYSLLTAGSMWQLDKTTIQWV